MPKTQQFSLPERRIPSYSAEKIGGGYWGVKSFADAFIDYYNKNRPAPNAYEPEQAIATEKDTLKWIRKNMWPDTEHLEYLFFPACLSIALEYRLFMATFKDKKLPGNLAATRGLFLDTFSKLMAEQHRIVHYRFLGREILLHKLIVCAMGILTPGYSLNALIRVIRSELVVALTSATNPDSRALRTMISYYRSILARVWKQRRVAFGPQEDARSEVLEGVCELCGRTERNLAGLGERLVKEECFVSGHGTGAPVELEVCQWCAEDIQHRRKLVRQYPDASFKTVRKEEGRKRKQKAA